MPSVFRGVISRPPFLVKSTFPPDFGDVKECINSYFSSFLESFRTPSKHPEIG
jgi:hypothetical protein